MTWVWEGTFAVRREVFDGVGGWPGHFFYGHESIDLMWKAWDRGYVGWYAPDIVVNHPSTSPARHAVYYRNERPQPGLGRAAQPALAAGGALPARPGPR